MDFKDITETLRYNGLVCCLCKYLVSNSTGFLESVDGILLFVWELTLKRPYGGPILLLAFANTWTLIGFPSFHLDKCQCPYGWLLWLANVYVHGRHVSGLFVRLTISHTMIQILKFYQQPMGYIKPRNRRCE